jgi:hypothetical protein
LKLLGFHAEGIHDVEDAARSDTQFQLGEANIVLILNRAI